VIVMPDRAVHLYSPVMCAPLCPTRSCGALYAIDGQGRERPEWVTCKRCLALMTGPPDRERGSPRRIPGAPCASSLPAIDVHSVTGMPGGDP
jgi:hypothetical protein